MALIVWKDRDGNVCAGVVVVVGTETIKPNIPCISRIKQCNLNNF